jgi:hypothetical protein
VLFHFLYILEVYTISWNFNSQKEVEIGKYRNSNGPILAQCLMSVAWPSIRTSPRRPGLRRHAHGHHAPCACGGAAVGGELWDTAQRGRRLEKEHIERDARGRFLRAGVHRVAVSTVGWWISMERRHSPTVAVLRWTTASSTSSFSLRTEREVRIDSSIRAQALLAVSHHERAAAAMP